ncbi:hypothetical protein [Mycobacterium kyorinense]|uniref:hypothetical protein n=1 Tax=Mycobacterium kyorinense TaxID=487514 RepID=UPI00190F4CE3|nr:hypothetical protein [Mycobacterium kyorinense]
MGQHAGLVGGEPASAFLGSVDGAGAYRRAGVAELLGDHGGGGCKLVLEQTGDGAKHEQGSGIGFQERGEVVDGYVGEALGG